MRVNISWWFVCSWKTR